MYSLKKLNTLKKLNKANIEEALKQKGYNHYDLLAFYIEGFKGIGVPINSPLRIDDKNASLHISGSKHGRIIISDFGLKTGMDIYEYINKCYFTGRHSDFLKVLGLIRNDFKLDTIEKHTSIDKRKKLNHLPSKHNKQVIAKQPVKLEVRRTRVEGDIFWSKEDIAYWESYGINTKYLEIKKVSPLDAFWITNPNKDNIRLKYDVTNELCYVYPSFRNKYGNFMYSIYLPKGFKGNEEFKWVKNVNKKVIQNINHIPNSGDLLIIQSSNKDVYVTEILGDLIGAKYSVVAPNGEGIWFADNEWNKLRKNWKRIVLFGNNDSDKKDNPGLAFARKHSSDYNIPFVMTPNNTTSDISDYRRKYGEKSVIELIKRIIVNIDLIT